MYPTQNFTQLQTIFGNGYAPEQHRDEHCEFVVDFEELLKRLRTALCPRAENGMQ